MSKMTTTRKITVSNLGPTVAEVRMLIDGAAPEARISITVDKGYGQLDPGSTTLTVEMQS